MTPLLTALSVLAGAWLTNAATVEVWWNITYATANPDGLFERRVIGVNGTWPPPPIEITRNDTLKVHALNGLDVPTSLHHHGMFFRNESYLDGAVAVTQCGIPPGDTFLYEFTMSEQWGTYWVHAHASGQYVDGLRAPFLIHNRPEVHQYDDEYTVILGDWYHDQHADLVAFFLSQDNPGGPEPVPKSSLIYFSHNGTYIPGYNADAKINFAPGKTYRLRIVNTSALAMFYFWIEGHDMRLIEADGTDLQETPTNMIALTVAQRYSVLVTARNDTSKNWAIHADMDTEMFDVVPDDLILNQTAVIVYNEASPLQEPSLVDAYENTVDDTELAPFTAVPIGTPYKSLELGVFFDTFDNGVNRAAFNNITWNAPVVPSLFSQLSMGADAENVDIYGPNAAVLEYNKIFELKVINWDAGKHPFHLHGHKFAIVHKSWDVASDDPELNPPMEEGLANPLWRDTVQIPPGGSVTMRFITNNPGTWFFHCHIEWHLEAGLAFTFFEAPTIAQQWVKPPQFMYDQCAKLGTPFTGNAAGHNSTTDLSGLNVGPYPQVLGWTPKAIGAMFACVFSAVCGGLTIVWYALIGQATSTV
ncbi:Ferroxidase [Serendipita vermifera MAFF 305830]|uniref:Ferroxidase n=1 Tax=Serendipita vermifera MAFF 305830 TaxID=933852 RepID=A0A0C2WYK5_SERVB|nr:Ferroxidase [Serendipita vermifera MAFF 305830]